MTDQLAATFCVILAVIGLSFAACEVPPPTPTLLDTLASKAITRENVTPQIGLRAMSEASYLPDQFATAHVRPMPQLPEVDGGLPIVMTPTTRPITGQEFILRWLTRPVASYPEGVEDSFDPALRVPPNYWTLPSIETYHPALRPDLPCALLITLDKPGEPQPIPGGEGAMLQVPPDYVLVPERILEPNRIAPHNRPGVPFEFVQDEYGKIMLRLTIPTNFNGINVWCQLLVADYRVPSGCVSTSMIELHVGSH